MKEKENHLKIVMIVLSGLFCMAHVFTIKIKFHHSNLSNIYMIFNSMSLNTNHSIVSIVMVLYSSFMGTSVCLKCLKEYFIQLC